jgi:hypothetical protein
MWRKRVTSGGQCSSKTKGTGAFGAKSAKRRQNREYNSAKGEYL